MSIVALSQKFERYMGDIAIRCGVELSDGEKGMIWMRLFHYTEGSQGYYSFSNENCTLISELLPREIQETCLLIINTRRRGKDLEFLSLPWKYKK